MKTETLSRPGLFKHVLIQTNVKCTLQCSFCLYGMKNVEVENVDMPDALFRKIVQELADIDYTGRVSLFEINEPLMDETLVEKIRHVKQMVPKSWQYISTNGDLLTPEKTTEMIDAGLDYLTINSYSYASYRKIKSLKKSLTDDVRSRIIHTDHFNPDFAADNRAGNLPHIAFVNEPLKESCSRVNNILYIKPDGKVVSCFGDFFSKNVMGDANTESIVDIWYGEPFTKLRSHLDNADRTPNELCSKCNMRAAGNYLERYDILPKLAQSSNLPRGAIVGASSSAQMFYPYLEKYTKIEWLVSHSLASAQPSKKIGRLKVSDNYSKVLTDPTLDFIFIANANRLHYETAVRALEAEKHVLIEKPLSLSLEEGHALIRLGREKNLVVGGIFQWRFMNTVKIVKELLSTHALGDIIFINCSLLWKRDADYFVNSRGTWKNDGGGVLMKQAIHCIDILLYLFGAPVAWHAFTSNTTGNRETEDSASVQIKFPEGMASLNATIVNSDNQTPEVDVIGTAGRITFDFNDVFKHWQCAVPEPELKPDGLTVFDKQMMNFVNAIQGKESLHVTAESCLASLSLILDIYKDKDFLKR